MTNRDVEREGRSRISVWQQATGAWAVTILPDEGEAGYPGSTYTRHGSFDQIPDDVPDDPEALLVWARAKVQSKPQA